MSNTATPETDEVHLNIAPMFTDLYRYRQMMLHAQNLERENAKLRVLVGAIKSETYGGIYAEDVNGGNWFDAREIILANAKSPGAPATE